MNCRYAVLREMPAKCFLNTTQQPTTASCFYAVHKKKLSLENVQRFLLLIKQEDDLCQIRSGMGKGRNWKVMILVDRSSKSFIKSLDIFSLMFVFRNLPRKTFL